MADIYDVLESLCDHRRPFTLILTDGTEVRCQAVTYIDVAYRQNDTPLATVIVWDKSGRKLTYQGSDIRDIRVDGPYHGLDLN